MHLIDVDHPLIDHKLAVLRDRTTNSAVFRQLVDELVTLLAYEATRHVRTEPVDIETPVAVAPCQRIAAPRPIVVPILRAGLDRGARDVTALCLLAAPEGLKYLEDAIGDRANVTVVTAAVDDHLNEQGYIVPGLGDAGDRLYGIVD